MSKNVGLKLSIVALAVVLASCGGGGSEGYFNNGNSGGSASGNNTGSMPNDPEETPELATSSNSFTQLTASKTALLLEGDTTAIQVKLLVSATGAVWANEQISLQIVDAQKYGASFAPSIHITEENGFANFNLVLNTSNLSQEVKAQLLTQGLTINVRNSEGITISTHSLKVVESESEKPLYDLVLSANKNELSLTGDNAVVTVRAVDTNGGSLAQRGVTLSLLDYTYARLETPSQLSTDVYGDAKFKVSLLPTTGQAATELKTKGITVTARIKDENGVTVTKILNIKVIDGVTLAPVGQITLGNAAELSKSSDGVYYTEKFSAQVVDVDGKPIKAPQKVTMKIDIVSGVTGYFLTNKQITALRDQDLVTFEAANILPVSNQIKDLELKKLLLNNQIADLDQNSPTYDASKQALEKQIRAVDYDILLEQNKLSTLNAKMALVNKLTVPSRVQWTCGNNPASQLATSLVDQTNNTLGNQYEYTTDNTGKFDFNINYQRRYARWQTVLLTASAKRTDGTEIQSTMLYPLGALQSDIDAETSQPFDTSPFNRNANDTCAYIKPWANLLN